MFSSYKSLAFIKQSFIRFYVSSPQEKLIYDKLIKALQPTSLKVTDISGGCGSMFAIDITSLQFSGLTMVNQHKLVNEVLKDDIKHWHGLQLRTRTK
ncbi:Bol3p Ecym_5022 [Eremothecium cymbalariae DBVPG|uniref:Uncharacterized protein n=1 Tax=Eremothecium cymbalariae (strain CBS 270.75 / DBVPG 7215 / KCTC 17166 / NRRL Y-17582) TaxID=931890 RepID=I6NCN1_ERECY|nr:hypothetical protein Ecym_5022 [Eremothecium cymbalariae DBVPG\